MTEMREAMKWKIAMDINVIPRLHSGVGIGVSYLREERGSPSTQLQLLSHVREHVLAAYEALILS